MTRKRYDTTPTEAERAAARARLVEYFQHGQRHQAGRDYQTHAVLGWLMGTVAGLTEAGDPTEARTIARARALAEAYQEEGR